MNKFKTFLICILTVCLGIPSYGEKVLKPNSGTVVRNGGDAVLTYLKKARQIMVTSLTMLRNEPDGGASACMRGQTVDAEAVLCKEFLQELAPQILQLAEGVNAVPFILSDKPLFVKDGSTDFFNMVAARTLLGNAGPIEFHRETIETMELSELVFLISHEFQHKASYKGRNLTDDEWIPDSGVMGRWAIDRTARTIAFYAEDHGLIGKKNGIKDNFECQIKTGTAQFGTQLSIDRVFFKNKSATDYKISLGNSPVEGSLYYYENEESKIEFRFLISSWGGCGELRDFKSTQMQIIRSTQKSGGAIAEEILKENFIFQNPVCPDYSKVFGLSYQNASFSCRYTGSTTNTP